MYQMTKEEVVREIYSRPSFLKKVTKCAFIQNPKLTESEAEIVAVEMIYSKCQQSFQYNEYCKSAADAVNRVSASDSSFMQWVDDTIKKHENKLKKEEEQRKYEAQQQAKEAARIEKLKKHCKENGLNFEIENKKYLKKMELYDNIYSITVTICLIGLIVAICINIFANLSDGSMIQKVMSALPWVFIGVGVVSTIVFCIIGDNNYRKYKEKK